MDLGRIRAYGWSRTRKAWVTNPLRGMLWRLLLPFFQGMAAEIERRQSELRGETQAIAADLDGRLRAELASVAAQASSVTARLAGGQKNALALAHRLAGLEEEAAANQQARRTLEGVVDAAAAEAREIAASLTGQVEAASAAASAAAALARETADYIAAVHQEVRQADQALAERMDALNEQTRMALGEANSAAVQAREAAAYIVSLHRGAALRRGDRLSVGPGGLTLVVTDGGTRFLVRQHDLIGGLVADGREWEPHVRAAIARAARPDGVAVDAGAYIGLHTVAMSRWFGSVHAFEPQRGIYQVLCCNLALNDCLNVETHNLALYDRAGSMRLAPPERQEVPFPRCGGQPDYANMSNAAALTFEVTDETSCVVRAVALDDLGLERVALIKVDTQGADLRVLRGAEATIRRCRPTVLLEWERDLSAQHGDMIEDYHAFFADVNYELTVLQETSPGRQIDYLATPR
jgi:FkbM family methyltransferase